MQLPLARVTAAEIVILRLVHGSDSVIKIKHIGERPVTDSQEFSRLAKKFEGHKIEGGGSIVALAFPGAAPILPSEVPAITRTVEQRAAEDSQVLSKDQTEAGDELLPEPVAIDENEEVDEVPEVHGQDADADELLDDRAA